MGWSCGYLVNFPFSLIEGDGWGWHSIYRAQRSSGWTLSHLALCARAGHLPFAALHLRASGARVAGGLAGRKGARWQVVEEVGQVMGACCRDSVAQGFGKVSPSVELARPRGGCRGDRGYAAQCPSSSFKRVWRRQAARSRVDQSGDFRPPLARAKHEAISTVVYRMDNGAPRIAEGRALWQAWRQARRNDDELGESDIASYAGIGGSLGPGECGRTEARSQRALQHDDDGHLRTAVADCIPAR